MATRRPVHARKIKAKKKLPHEEKLAYELKRKVFGLAGLGWVGSGLGWVGSDLGWSDLAWAGAGWPRCRVPGYSRIWVLERLGSRTLGSVSGLGSPLAWVSCSPE